MLKRLQYLLPVLILAIPLTLALNGVARDVIATPVLYIFWIARLVLLSVPQTVIWALLLALALVAGLKGIDSGWRPGRRAATAETGHPGRVATWARWIQHAPHGNYSKWHLSHEFGSLMLDVLSTRDRLTRRQFRQRLEAGELSMPPEIQAYLLAGVQPVSSKPSRLFARLAQRRVQGAQTSPLDLDPESVVRFLEDQLEVQGGHQNS